MNPVLGVFLHALGGYAAGSFYIPFRKVKNWAWESYWIISGVFAWIVAPWIVAFVTVPDLMSVFRTAPSGSMAACYVFGVLWGVGGLTFGLSMRSRSKHIRLCHTYWRFCVSRGNNRVRLGGNLEGT
jgi:L-rhamnose-H+ transport protein